MEPLAGEKILSAMGECSAQVGMPLWYPHVWLGVPLLGTPTSNSLDRWVGDVFSGELETTVCLSPQLRLQRLCVGRLKFTMVGGFTRQKLANATDRGF